MANKKIYDVDVLMSSSDDSFSGSLDTDDVALIITSNDAYIDTMLTIPAILAYMYMKNRWAFLLHLPRIVYYTIDYLARLLMKGWDMVKSIFMFPFRIYHGAINIFKWLWSIGSKIWKWIKKIGGFFKSVWEKFVNIFKKIGGFIENVVRKVRSAIEAVGEFVKSAIKNIRDIKSFFSYVGKEISNIVKNIFRTVADGIRRMFTKEFYVRIGETIIRAARRTYEFVANIVKSFARKAIKGTVKLVVGTSDRIFTEFRKRWFLRTLDRKMGGFERLVMGKENRQMMEDITKRIRSARRMEEYLEARGEMESFRAALDERKAIKFFRKASEFADKIPFLQIAVGTYIRTKQFKEEGYGWFHSIAGSLVSETVATLAGVLAFAGVSIATTPIGGAAAGVSADILTEEFMINLFFKKEVQKEEYRNRNVFVRTGESFKEMYEGFKDIVKIFKEKGFVYGMKTLWAGVRWLWDWSGKGIKDFSEDVQRFFINTSSAMRDIAKAKTSIFKQNFLRQIGIVGFMLGKKENIPRADIVGYVEYTDGEKTNEEMFEPEETGMEEEETDEEEIKMLNLEYPGMIFASFLAKKGEGKTHKTIKKMANRYEDYVDDMRIYIEDVLRPELDDLRNEYSELLHS